MGILVWAQGVEKIGLDRDLNPGPRAPKARIIPLDHQAAMVEAPDPAVAPKRWESLVTMEIEIVKNIYLVSMEIWLIIPLSNMYASGIILQILRIIATQDRFDVGGLTLAMNQTCIIVCC